MKHQSDTIASAYLVEFERLVTQLCRKARVDVDEEAIRWVQWNHELRSTYKEGITLGLSSSQAFDYAIREFGTSESLAARYRDPWLVRCMLYQRTRMTCLVIILLYVACGGLAFKLLPAAIRPYSLEFTGDIPITDYFRYWPTWIFIYVACAFYRRKVYHEGRKVQFWIVTLIMGVMIVSLLNTSRSILPAAEVFHQSWNVKEWLSSNAKLQEILSDPGGFVSLVLVVLGMLLTPVFVLCAFSLVFDLAHYKQRVLPLLTQFWHFLTLLGKGHLSRMETRLRRHGRHS